jgi:hypothetical protein
LTLGWSLYHMCTYWQYLSWQKKLGYPILATMNLKCSSGIVELRIPGSFRYPPSWSCRTGPA